MHSDCPALQFFARVARVAVDVKQGAVSLTGTGALRPKPCLMNSHLPKAFVALAGLAVGAVLVVVLLRDTAQEPASAPDRDVPAPSSVQSAMEPSTTASAPPAAPGLFETPPDLASLRLQCAAGDGHACHQLSLAALGAIDPDALIALRDICRDGVVSACLYGGVVARERGDPALASEMLRAACGAEIVEACDLLAKLDPDYDPAAIDREREAAERAELERIDREQQAQAAYRCDAGDNGACNAVAARAFDDLAPEGAAAAALPGVIARCDAGDAHACVTAAHGQLVVDPAASAPRLRLLDRACALGLAEACELAAKDRGELPPEPTREERIAMLVAEAFERQSEVFGDAVARCDTGDADACRQRAWMLAQGNGVEADVAAARGIFEDQCSADDVAGCFALAMLLRSDTSANAAASMDEVLALFERACSAGIVEACEQVEKLGAR